MRQRPQNVGIHAIDIYFPKPYISQSEFETFTGASKGKYTLGLGQTGMSFVYDFEDVNSMALTVVQNLLEKFNIDPRSIGRLEVGTETLVDKSKSTKTVLMQLFSKYGNHDIEGVTSLNACYGGTNAFFNTTNWIQSEAWDGRYGIVVMTDIAIYAKGPARPTGGVGAVAMLVGADAPFVLENQRYSFMDHTYDFYKPNMASEFPLVDGQLSLETYKKALANCYAGMKQKYRAEKGEDFNLDQVDYCCFHNPFCKLVAKAFTTLFELDMKENILSGKQLSEDVQASLADNRKQPLDEKISAKINQEYWNAKTAPSLYFSAHLGNIYTGSLFAGLVSLITDTSINLENKRILMFSYGGGLASSMFVLRCNGNPKFISEKIQARERLNNRVKISCEVFDRIMDERMTKYNKAPVKPEVQSDLLFDGTFYLESIDEKFKRNYVRKQINTNTSATVEVKDESKGTAARRLNLIKGHMSSSDKSGC